MSKILHAVAIAALALALPLVALADTHLNLDTGTTGSSGGDIVFNPGTSIAPVGSAQLADLTTAFGSEFSTLVASGFLESVLASETYSTAPIGASSLVANEVIAVKTNGGNYAAILVTAASSGSITLQYVTYNTSGTKIQGLTTVTLGGPAAPSITMVQNNYSYILPNAPNYGIAPGTLFIVVGSAMAAPGSPAVLQNPSNPLPQTLNGSTVSVTVNGTTVQPAFYYAIPTQLGVVLPSNTPVGTGTITVSSLFPYLGNTLPSLGSCIVYQQGPVAPVNPFQLAGLNPGTVSVTGANGTQALSGLPSGPGLYTAALTSGFLPPTAGSFMFNGLGGTDVQPFNAALDFPNPLSWTNSSAAGTITRAQGLTVNWTGGDPGTYVQISGSATTVGATVFFICDAPVSPATFTVPPAVLLALPAAGGGLQVSNFTNPKSFSATGLDFGYAASYVSAFVSTTYQ